MKPQMMMRILTMTTILAMSALTTTQLWADNDDHASYFKNKHTKREMKSVGSKSENNYVQDKFIVKFKNDGPLAMKDCGDCTFRNPHEITKMFDNAADLDALITKYNVVSITPLQSSFAGSAKNKDKFTKMKYQKRSARAAYKSKKSDDFNSVFIVKLRTDKEIDIEKVSQAFDKEPHVKYAQPIYFLSAKTPKVKPNPKPVADLWGWKAIQGKEALSYSKGKGVVVAVLDSGVDTRHIDLAANVWKNTGEIANNGKDDDMNGFIDDVRGWNFFANSNDVSDMSGQGTHIAGIIAAVSSKNSFMQSVAPNAMIMPIKIFDLPNQVSILNLVQGIEYAIDNGADILFSSYSCLTPCQNSPLVEEAVTKAHDAGVVAIFASGDNGKDMFESIPQAMKTAITVGASGKDNFKTPTSNFGYGLSLMAPGVGILSLKNDGGYQTLDGTATSGAFTAGVAALVLERHPTWSNDDVKATLQSTTQRIEPSVDLSLGFGILNSVGSAAMNTILRVKITSPIDSASINIADGVIPLYGYVDGSNFISYEVLDSKDLKTWTTINGPIQSKIVETIPALTIGTLDLKALGTGNHVIRVKATDTKGWTFDDYIMLQIYGNSDATQEITNETYDHYFPVSDGKIIIWIEPSPDGMYKLVAYDIANKTRKNVATLFSKMNRPDVHDNDVLYADFNPETNVVSLFHLNLATGNTRVLSSIDAVGNIRYLYNARIDKFEGKKVVWMEPNPDESGYFNITIHDLVTGTESVISDTTANQAFPDIDRNIVVWEDYATGHANIVMHDLNTNTNTYVSSVSFDQTNPSISDGKIVWQDKRIDYQYEIYLFDTKTHIETRITDNIIDDIKPRVSSKHVVWEEHFNDSNVNSYNIATEKTTILSNNLREQIDPALGGDDTAVWTDNKNKDAQVMMLRLN